MRVVPKSVCFAILALGLSLPAAAQDNGDIAEEDEVEAVEEAAPARRGPAPFIVDLAITKPRSESDRLLEEDCEQEADAGRVAGEIVVCRRIGEASDGSWDKESWEQDYARRTQGEQPVNVAGGGIFSGPATVSGLCVIPPCPPEAALMIDVEALPQAPEGSDADRIARGLPPLGEDELSAEEIAERRRALGLEAPPVPGE